MKTEYGFHPLLFLILAMKKSLWICIVLDCPNMSLIMFFLVFLVNDKNLGCGIENVAPTMSMLGIPWGEIAINTIGPWKIVPPPHGTVVFNGFTIIDTTTGILEICHATQQNSSVQEACNDLDNA